MIPLCLVTGFLGSGKTTLLRRIADRHRHDRIVYLVNEFSPRDIDGALFEQVEEDVVAIPGGSIFCRCLVTEFLGHLQRIPERFHREDDPVMGVVIEASGVADPRVIEQMLRETRLDAVYALASIISVVDPGSLPRLVHTLPNIRAQVEAADVVLINKIDLFTPDEVDAAEQIVRTINPAATTMRTVRCSVDLELFAGARVRGLEGEYALCADPNYARFAIDFTEPVNADELRAELEAVRDEVYRAKGFVPTAEGLAYLDMSAAALTLEPASVPDGAPGLVVIARGEDHAGVSEFARRHGAMEA